MNLRHNITRFVDITNLNRILLQENILRQSANYAAYDNLVQL